MYIIQFINGSYSSLITDIQKMINIEFVMDGEIVAIWNIKERPKAEQGWSFVLNRPFPITMEHVQVLRS